ncbi:MAG: VOC family protein [Sphingomonadaceae bacterium]|nr:VOC family protein [Sphingomonadaceae bacterium]
MKGSLTFAATLLLSALSLPAAAAPSLGLAGHRLHQVAITTRDLPRAIAFYRDTLGLPMLFESNGMAFFDVDGLRLMVATDPARLTPERPGSILYFDAPDFDSTLARLVALGLRLEGGVETVQRTATGELRLQQFVDPDGNALAIMGLVPAR